MTAGTTGSSTEVTGTASPAGATSPDTGTTGPTRADAKVTPGAAGATSTGTGTAGWGRVGYVLPVAVFLFVAAWLAVGLTRDPSTLPSALIDKPVPVFKLPPLKASGIDGLGLSTEDLTGKVQLVNVFASWCGPCRIEHPVLMKLAKDGMLIQGLNYKDKPDDAAGFLTELGNPYERIGADGNGRVGIEWGVYGVPETFIIDKEGKIRHKHVGPIQARDVEGLMAIIEDIRQ